MAKGVHAFIEGGPAQSACKGGERLLEERLLEVIGRSADLRFEKYKQHFAESLQSFADLYFLYRGLQAKRGSNPQTRVT